MKQESKQVAENWKTESGRVLKSLTLSYRIYGDLNDASRPVVWVCHALTANDDPFDWWAGLFGENDLFNPKDYTIVCANMLGSCYGSVGPLSKNPDEEGELYLHDFPQTTVRDNAKAFSLLADELDLKKVNLLIGGSLGGQVALQWAIHEPQRFESLALLATNSQHSPWGIAFNQSQRMAIETDPSWKQNDPSSGIDGMKVARSLALLSYRNYDCYNRDQLRSEKEALFDYRVQSYQTYQGEKLALRFNAISYHRLSHTMDSHDISKGYGSIEAALKRLTMPVLTISMEGDILFPPKEQMVISEGAERGEHYAVSTKKGHDGFLIETKKLTEILQAFMEKRAKRKITVEE